MIGEAERRFPVRIKMAVPAGGFGTRLTDINAWLDTNCGADGWAMTPAGLRGVVNDAVAIYFLDPASAAGFLVRYVQGRDRQRRIPHRGGRAEEAGAAEGPQDAVTGARNADIRPIG